MREIKFRGKSKRTKEWVYGFLFELSYDGIPCLCIGIEPLSANDYGEIHQSCYEEVIPETVGQYTGLKDKNGKAIYEGDFAVNKGKHHTVIGQIVYGQIPSNRDKGGHQGFYIKWQNDCCNCWDDWWRHDLHYWINQIEVIGNIHDNPELLEVSE
jgi:uncharacterized phage protein (TIGR01671 family)